VLGVRTPGMAVSSSGPSDGAAGGSPGCNSALPACRHYLAMNSAGQVAFRKGKAKLAKR
jgi:hypothetical protein